MSKVFINIGQLVQVRESDQGILRGPMMADVPTLEHAFLRIENGKIISFGEMTAFEGLENEEQIDLKGRMVTPTFVDSHTHLVFAADRDEEYVMKLKGIDYQDIAEAGGGILNSAGKLQKTPFEELLTSARQRLKEAIQAGTGAIEIKSGYGLTFDAELKMLKVIAMLKEEFNIPIRATFLGAHAFPNEDHEAYLSLLTEELMPAISKQGLADYVDCFCEVGYYNIGQFQQILEAAEKFDLKPKVHVNQFNSIGGIEKAVEFGALTVDHLEVLDDAEIDVLKESDTIPVALPGCSYFLNIDFTPGRKIIDSGLPLVIASDFNPGSAPSFNMSLINSLACTKMRLLPNEAFNASTFNAAFALELENEVGSISEGKRANFIVGKAGKNLNSISYNFGVNWIDKVFIEGELIE